MHLDGLGKLGRFPKNRARLRDLIVAGQYENCQACLSIVILVSNDHERLKYPSRFSLQNIEVVARVDDGTLS